MPAIFEYVHEVLPEEIDALGHANNVSYLSWMQTAAIAHSAAQGWPMERYRQLGAGWVVREHRIEYLRPARLGQTVIVRTWVADFRKVVSRRKYRIQDSEGRVLATGETLWAFVNLETFSPCRVPRELIESFPVVADEREVLHDGTS
jgi:acyl-CoA thioester hydrolase